MLLVQATMQLRPYGYTGVLTPWHGNGSTLVYASNVSRDPNGYLVIRFGRNLLCSLKWPFKRGYSEVITLLSSAKTISQVVSGLRYV